MTLQVSKWLMMRLMSVLYQMLWLSVTVSVLKGCLLCVHEPLLDGLRGILGAACLVAFVQVLTYDATKAGEEAGTSSPP